MRGSAPYRGKRITICFLADNEGGGLIGVRVMARSTDSPTQLTRRAAERLGLAFELRPVCFWTFERGRVDARLDWPILSAGIPDGCVLEAEIVPPPAPRVGKRLVPTKGGPTN